MGREMDHSRKQCLRVSCHSALEQLRTGAIQECSAVEKPTTRRSFPTLVFPQFGSAVRQSWATCQRCTFGQASGEQSGRAKPGPVQPSCLTTAWFPKASSSAAGPHWLLFQWMPERHLVELSILRLHGRPHCLLLGRQSIRISSALHSSTTQVCLALQKKKPHE